MSLENLSADTYETTRSAPGVVLIGWRDAATPDAFTTTLEEAAERHPDVTVATIDGEQEHQLAGLAHVGDLPTLVVLRDGIDVSRTSDPLEPGTLDETIASVAALDMQDVRQKWAEKEAERHLGG
jgi:thioredoxin-like negative regulator of GroEL